MIARRLLFERFVLQYDGNRIRRAREAPLINDDHWSRERESIDQNSQFNACFGLRFRRVVSHSTRLSVAVGKAMKVRANCGSVSDDPVQTSEIV